MKIEISLFIISLGLSALTGWFIAVMMMGTHIAERNKQILDMQQAEHKERESRFIPKGS